MSFLLPILPRLLAVLAAAGALWYGWHQVNQWCNSACQAAEAKVTVLEEQAQAARDRATSLALLWAKELDNVKERIKERVVVRTQTFGGIRERVGKIGNGVAIPVDADTRRLLDDIAVAANAGNPAAAAGDTGAGQAVPDSSGRPQVQYDETVYTQLRDWAQFAADAGEAYNEAVTKHLACVAAYEALEKGNE